MTRQTASGGALTGATGDLTPDEVPQAFVPAERREVSDPDHQGDVTGADGRGGAPRDGGDEAADLEDDL